MSFQRTIDIVSHVYCPPGVDTYAKHLIWQYASLRAATPESIRVRYKVCMTLDDRETSQAIRRCIDDMHRWQDKTGSPTALTVQIVLCEPRELFRRSIGRNRATLGTLADVVWFTDVDYLFGDGCLLDVATMVRPDECAMPSNVKISRDHQCGQNMVDNPPLDEDGWPKIVDELFAERRERKAIGGLQIVGGDVVRKRGYLRDDPAWQTPVDPTLGFRSCRCDVAFRRYIGLPFQRIPIRNVYRIRHTQDGRDFDLRGNKLGRDAW